MVSVPKTISYKRRKLAEESMDILFTIDLTLLNAVVQIGILVVLLIAAIVARQQLRHIRLTADVEFMAHFDEELVRGERNRNRKMIYLSVPNPYLQKQRHEDWLKKLKRNSRIFEVIESELYNLDRLGLFLKESKMRKKLVLDLFFDIMARYTILLHNFIVKERMGVRGGAYMLNFIWLARENLEYIDKNYRHIKPPIKLRGIPITVEDISKGVRALELSLEGKPSPDS